MTSTSGLDDDMVAPAVALPPTPALVPAPAEPLPPEPATAPLAPGWAPGDEALPVQPSSS